MSRSLVTITSKIYWQINPHCHLLKTLFFNLNFDLMTISTFQRIVIFTPLKINSGKWLWMQRGCERPFLLCQSLHRRGQAAKLWETIPTFTRQTLETWLVFQIIDHHFALGSILFAAHLLLVSHWEGKSARWHCKLQAASAHLNL